MANQKQKLAQQRLNELLAQEEKNKKKNVITAVIAALVVIFLSVIIIVAVRVNDSGNSTAKLTESDLSSEEMSKITPFDPNETWHSQMILGDPTAKNHFVEYSDILCPWCAKFSMQLWNNKDELTKKYLDNKDFYLELRIGNYLGPGKNGETDSQDSAESVYCAARQNKFWEYYESLIGKLNDDYYSKNIGYHGGPQVPQLERSYYDDAAQKAGLDSAAFTKCLDDGTGKADVAKVTKSSTELSGGLPYFRFNSYKSNGFNGDWSTIQKMFDAGLK